MPYDDADHRRENIHLLERVHRMEVEISSLTTAINSDRKVRENLITELTNLVRDHHDAIYGGHHGPGINEQINSLRKVNDEKQKHMNILTVATVTAVVNMLVTWLKKAVSGD